MNSRQEQVYHDIVYPYNVIYSSLEEACYNRSYNCVIVPVFYRFPNRSDSAFCVNGYMSIPRKSAEILGLRCVYVDGVPLYKFLGKER